MRVDKTFTICCVCVHYTLCACLQYVLSLCSFFVFAGKQAAEQKTTSRASCSPQGPQPSTNVNSPSPGKLKRAFKAALESIKKQRNKASLIKKRLLYSLVRDNGSNDCENLFVRRKIAPGTEAVRVFLEESAVNTPGKHSVSKRTGIQKEILPKRMKRLHKEFLRENPEKQVSLRTMYRRSPKHILTSKILRFHQCLCERCANIDLKLNVLNKHLSTEIDGRDTLSEASLCAAAGDACLDRKCEDCGPYGTAMTQRLKLKDSSQLSTLVKWKVWDMVDNEKGLKRRQLVCNEGSVGELITNLKEELLPFSRHIYNFRWQYVQFRAIHNNLPPTWALAIMDFAKNFLCRYQNEVQSVYWSYNQVTVHPCVVHYRCPTCSQTTTEHLVFFSDDLKHDGHLVNSIQEKTMQHLLSTLKLDKVIIFSDGCPVQYKSKLPFYHLANIKTVAVERCYFGSRHRKSECDAVGGVIKRLVEDDIITGSVIQNSRDMYEHCVNHHVLPEAGDLDECCHKKRSFFLIHPDTVDRTLLSSALKTVPGTRLLHSIKPMSGNTVATRRLSCFCAGCIADRPEECINSMPWTTVHLPALKTNQLSSGSPEQEESPRPPQEVVVQSPVTMPQPPAPQLSLHPETREQYFDSLLARINHCKTYGQLTSVVKDSKITDYPLPHELPKTILDVGGRIDSNSLSLRPSTVPAFLYPICTGADGNCLPRIVSTLVFGNEKYHIEMRCRIIAELVQNDNIYLQGLGMGGPEVVAKVATLTESATTTGHLSSQHLKQLFEQDAMDVRALYRPVGLWQLAAISNIVHAPVQSVYPNLGWETYQSLHNIRLEPQNLKRQEALFIMWTAARGDMQDRHWVANHFVPLIPIADSVSTAAVEDFHNTGFYSEEVDLHDYFIVEWENHNYVAHVRDVDHELPLVHLNFMKARNGKYYWPCPEDLSWESFDVLKERVTVELDLAASNRRMQFYRVS